MWSFKVLANKKCYSVDLKKKGNDSLGWQLQAEVESMLRSVQDSTLIGTRAPEFWSNPDKTYGQNNSKTLRTTVQRWGVQLVRASRRSCAQSKQGYETPRAQWNLSQGQRGITTFLFFPLTIPPPCFLSHVQPHCLTHMSDPPHPPRHTNPVTP